MTIEIEGYFYALPDSWEDITLTEFIEINELAKNPPEKNAVEADKFNFYVNFISNFGIPKEHLRKVKLYDAEGDSLGLMNLFNHLWQFTQLPEQGNFEAFSRFFLGDTMYYYNTNTETSSGGTRALSDYTFEEYEEANGVLTAMNHLKEGQLEKLALLCAIFFRPAKNKWFQFFREVELEPYDVNTVSARAEVFTEELTMDKVWNCYFFLLSRMMRLSNDTLSCLRVVAEKLQT